MENHIRVCHSHCKLQPKSIWIFDFKISYHQLCKKGKHLIYSGYFGNANISKKRFNSSLKF